MIAILYPLKMDKNLSEAYSSIYESSASAGSSGGHYSDGGDGVFRSKEQVGSHFNKNFPPKKNGKVDKRMRSAINTSARDFGIQGPTTTKDSYEPEGEVIEGKKYGLTKGSGKPGGAMKAYLDKKAEKLQKEKDVIKNPEYFNKAVTKTAWKEPLNRAIADLLYRDVKEYDVKVKNPEKYTKEDLKTMGLNLDFMIALWDKSYLKTLGYVQVRAQENARHITDIAGYMRDKGDALGANYILIWESDLRIGNGNCTLKAALSVDSITKCKVIIIPEWFEKLHKLEERDRRHIGNLFNKIKRERTDEISEGDVIKDLIYDYQHHNIPFDSKRNKDLLVQDYGFHINKANSIIKKSEIEHAIKQQKSTHRTSIIYNKKTHPDDYDNLIKKEAELSDENTLVITGSSGGWKSLYVQTHEEIIKNPDKQHIINLIHHGDGLKVDPVENREKWDGNSTTKGKKERFEPTMKHMVENLKPIIKKDKFGNTFEVKRTYRIEYMPFDKADSK